MKKLFGTDGIRGVANQYPMTVDMALKAGRAAAAFCRANAGTQKPKIVIGRDTRVSGQMLECALISGICSMGGDVVTAGGIPTPGVAYLTRHLRADAGIVVSASHNPYADNGIKFFSGEGFKLSDQKEAEIEALILDEAASKRFGAVLDIGVVHPLPQAETIYSDFLKDTVSHCGSFREFKIVLDCSNGATFTIAPRLFTDLGARVESIAASPDGFNINAQCGSQHPERLAEKVVESGSDIGFAFDGDGDRLIAADERGAILTGDQVLAVFTAFLLKNRMLENRTVVSTVMSNIGFSKALGAMGVNHVMSAVGDRYVMEQMMDAGAILGGEDSGHIILRNHHTTGDGILAAVQLLAVMQAQAQPLSSLAGVMTVFPQVLINVAVKTKDPMENIPEIKQAVESIETALKAGGGRVLVRYSGTQPVCRVMVEAPKVEEARRYCETLVEVIQRKLG
jgi:phosphoglucosamine mutase